MVNLLAIGKQGDTSLASWLRTQQYHEGWRLSFSTSIGMKGKRTRGKRRIPIFLCYLITLSNAR